MLLDSNIIIYAALPEHAALRALIASHAPAVVLQISTEILDRATQLRQQSRIGLGDALIGATALVHDLRLLTANTGDFQWIPDLRISNPVN